MTKKDTCTISAGHGFLILLLWGGITFLRWFPWVQPAESLWLWAGGLASGLAPAALPGLVLSAVLSCFSDVDPVFVVFILNTAFCLLYLVLTAFVLSALLSCAEAKGAEVRIPVLFLAAVMLPMFSEASAFGSPDEAQMVLFLAGFLLLLSRRLIWILLPLSWAGLWIHPGFALRFLPFFAAALLTMDTRGLGLSGSCGRTAKKNPGKGAFSEAPTLPRAEDETATSAADIDKSSLKRKDGWIAGILVFSGALVLIGTEWTLRTGSGLSAVRDRLFSMTQARFSLGDWQVLASALIRENGKFAPAGRFALAFLLFLPLAAVALVYAENLTGTKEARRLLYAHAAVLLPFILQLFLKAQTGILLYEMICESLLLALLFVIRGEPASACAMRKVRDALRRSLRYPVLLVLYVAAMMPFAGSTICYALDWAQKTFGV